MRIFVTAVAGTGMGSLAGLLVELGHDVAGSDTAFFPPMGPALAQWGVRTFEGFDRAHLLGMAHGGSPPEVVIVGNVCRKDNPEAVAADELRIERLHIADALQRFALKNTSSLVVTGTHGKTTTSSLCAHLLTQAGFYPGYLIGGIVNSLEGSFKPAGRRTLKTTESRMGIRKTPFVVEGDEYDTAYWEKTAKFLHYGAEVVVLTSIEHDHVDIYPTKESYVQAFRDLMAQLPADGLVVAYAGDEEVVSIAQQAPCEVTYYALDGDAHHGKTPHFLGHVAERSAQGTSFDLFAGTMLVGRFLSPLPGDHNVRNALAAIAACSQGYGASLRSLMEPLARFEGVKRRQELLGKPGGVLLFDDFAHHPTAVRETLMGIRAAHPEGRLIAIFEPRSATACRRMHQQAYRDAFDAADHVLLAPVGRELPQNEALDVPRLADEITQKSSVGSAAHTPQAEALTTVGKLVERAVQLARPGDCVVTLSNGAFGGIHGKLLAALEAAPHFSGESS